MQNSEIINIIKRGFEKKGNPAQIPLLKGDRTFKAILDKNGVSVSNLGNEPFLPWNVFVETVYLLKKNGGRAVRGNAMKGVLGDGQLPIDSVEGHIARVVYGKKKGDTVFRRITPIACILIWAGICQHKPRELVLVK
jgi:hypothetical protein